MHLISIPIVFVAAYLLGNINFAIIISKVKNRNILKEGSGNPGTMNMARSLGIKWGILTLLLDAGKGVAGALLGWLFISTNQDQMFMLSTDKVGMLMGGLGVVIGHIYPVFLKFKGGKGIATTIGVCLVFAPIATPISFVAALSFLFIFKMGAIASFIAITPPLAITAFVLSTTPETADPTTAIIASLICLLIFFLALWAHRSNIKQMFSGTDSKLILLKKRKKNTSPQQVVKGRE
ncbi:MAG: glycerol-3-phosphate acyltransferase [Firmicutes bacterium]|nr:glycerol-3-phosphate acyltransferase [Bacillota bacterium]